MTDDTGIEGIKRTLTIAEAAGVLSQENQELCRQLATERQQWSKAMSDKGAAETELTMRNIELVDLRRQLAAARGALAEIEEIAAGTKPGPWYEVRGKLRRIAEIAKGGRG